MNLFVLQDVVFRRAPRRIFLAHDRHTCQCSTRHASPVVVSPTKPRLQQVNKDLRCSLQGARGATSTCAATGVVRAARPTNQMPVLHWARTRANARGRLGMSQRFRPSQIERGLKGVDQEAQKGAGATNPSRRQRCCSCQDEQASLAPHSDSTLKSSAGLTRHQLSIPGSGPDSRRSSG